MNFRILKEKVHEIPFGKAGTVRFQVGWLLDDSGTKRFRYTRSLERHRGRYRITLQSEPPDEFHTPYVFDALPPAPDTPPEIYPDNDEARQLWQMPENALRAKLHDALISIMSEDALR